MLSLQTPEGFKDHVGATLGPTNWRRISQSEINTFAKVTGDDHWVHVDVERAAREGPGGRTIAHGLYVLSLIPEWQRSLFRIERRGAGLSYGYDRVRFVAPIPVDTPIRLIQTVTAATPHRLGTRVSLTSTIERETPGSTAIVAEAILLIASG
ncbi:MaoC family dehydratase [Antarctobacter sp.]|uniref:MaoC family dehydratase n=1 Tax=Antarctobacter sp. TaxID=1872577 RepID=UPI002B27AB54|nr:MaoC family dehydratase [Antarctobacter sp.]